MNFSELKLGFKEYLLRNQYENGYYASGENADIDVSIFNNISEFSKYVKKELNLDASQALELVQNINNLQKYEIVDGQLVDTDSFEKTEEEPVAGATVNADAEAAETEALPAEGEIPPAEGEAVTTEGEAVPAESQIPDNGQEMEMADAEGSQNAIVGILNELLQDKNFAEFIDRDEDGEVSDKDLSEFYDAIKDYDGDNQSISLDDIIAALEDIQNGKFLYPNEAEVQETQEAQEEESSVQPEKAEEPKPEQTSQSEKPAASTDGTSNAGRTAGTSNAGRTGGTSGGSSTGGSAPASTQQAANNFENMSVEELEEQKTVKQNELNSARDDVNSVHNGQNEAVSAAKEDCEKKKDAYVDAVKEADEELGAELESCLDNISAKEQEIDDTKVQINDKQNEITDQESAIASTESNIEALKSALSALDGQQSDDPERQAQIDAQKESVNAQIQEMEAERDRQKDELDTMKSDLDDLNEKLEDQEADLEKLNSNEGDPRGKAQIEADIAALKNNDAVMEAKDAYDTAKEKVESVKTTELEKANQVVETKQSELDAINEKLNEAKAKEIQKANAMDALSMYNEEYGTNLANAAASLFPNSGFGGYCAAGVSDSLVAGTGRDRTYGNGCDYADVMRGRDDFMEYSDFDFNNMSSEDVQSFLQTLPAGAVVSFGATSSHPYGHVMIMDGKGNEISDGTNAIGTYYRNSYSSMSVYIPVG